MPQNHPFISMLGLLHFPVPPPTPRLRLFSVITNPPLITIARFHKIIQGKAGKKFPRIRRNFKHRFYFELRMISSCCIQSTKFEREKKEVFSTRTTVVLLRKAGFEQFNCRVFRLYKNRFNLASLIHRFKTSLLENFPSSTISLRAVLRHQALSCLEAHPVN